MKRLLLIACLVTIPLVAVPTLARADCFADYKAKRDDPLRLHYGVARIDGACTTEAAEKQLSSRLTRHGWILLTVVSVFDADGLDERKASAGAHFLAY